jgi:hypothetical protein
MAKRPTIDLTDQGAQRVIPGAERITDAELARRKIAQPLRPSVPQRPADTGLFGDGHLQQPLPLTGGKGR